MKNNLTLSCEGYLCNEWQKAKKNYVVTIAVHVSYNKTEFIDLVCKEDKVKGKKGSKMEVYGFPIIQVYKGKGKYMLFVDEIYEM